MAKAGPVEGVPEAAEAKPPGYVGVVECNGYVAVVVVGAEAVARLRDVLAGLEAGEGPA
jgi:hypothetical protein